MALAAGRPPSWGAKSQAGERDPLPVSEPRHERAPRVPGEWRLFAVAAP